MKKRYTPKQKAQIVLEMLKEERSVAQISSEFGVHPSQLHKWKAQALESLPSLFEDEHKGEKALKAEHERRLKELYTEIGKLSTQLAWLKKNLASNLRRSERLEMLEREQSELSLATQAELLRVSRSSLYYRPVGPSAKEIAVRHRIDEIYTRHPIYGSRRMTAVLGREGWSISRPTVQVYMREMGIAGIAPGPKTSQPSPEHKVYPYLLRHREVCRPNQVWGIDITYVRLRAGWMFLVAILDWFSRFVVSWELDQTLESSFVLHAVDHALAQARPEIWNSDQGSHFTSPKYTQRLLDAQVQISMDGRGRAMDNVFTERLWRSVKYEEVYLKDYAIPREARLGIGNYLTFYNYERPHPSLGYLTPAEVYFQASPLSTQVDEFIALGAVARA
jgi:putative transposase